MNGNLAQFGEDLRLHLLRLQVSLGNINELFVAGKVTNQAELANRLDELHTTAKDCSNRATELRQTLQDGLEQEEAHAPETLSRWVGRRQTAQLHARADLIEQLAIVAVELAALSVLEAERITMTAIIARQQAVAIQIQRHNYP